MLNPRRFITVALVVLAFGALSLTSAGYKEDSQYAAGRLRQAFFQEDRTELHYAWRSLAIACASEAMSSNTPVPALSPACDTLTRVLREGCGDPEAEDAPGRSVGRFVEAEVARERHWPAELITLLRDISNRLRIAHNAS